MNRGGLGALLGDYAALEGGDVPASLSGSAANPPRAKPAAKAVTPASKPATKATSVKRVASRSPAGRPAAPSTTAAAATGGKKAAPATTKTPATATAGTKSNPAAPKPAAKPAATNNNDDSGDDGSDDDDAQQQHRQHDMNALRQVSSDGPMIREATTSFTEQEEKQMLKTLNDLRDAHSNGKVFNDTWPSATEAKTLHWERCIGGASSSLLPLDINAVKQGANRDCFIIASVIALSRQHPELVDNLFLTKELNSSGIYAIRLWSNARWRLVIVDDKFPVKTAGSQDFLFASGSLALMLIEKAIAKLHGGFEALSGGVPIEALIDLTGMPCRKCKTKSHVAMSNEIGSSFVRGFSMVASCGGAEREAAARKLGLRTQHAYSVVGFTQSLQAAAAHHYAKAVWLRDPWGRTDFVRAGAQQEGPKNDDAQYLNNPGTFYVSTEEFSQCFSLLVVCETAKHGYQQVLSAPFPQCVPQSSFLPAEIVNGSSVISFTVTAAPCEVVAMASQSQIRLASTTATGAKTAYFDMSVLLLEMPSEAGKIPRLVEMSPTVVDRLAILRHVFTKPGHFLLVPMSLQQAGTADQEMGLTLLVKGAPQSIREQRQVQQQQQQPTTTVLQTPLNREIHTKYLVSHMNKWFFNWMRTQEACVKKEYNNAQKAQLFETLKLQHGFMFLGAMRNLSAASLQTCIDVTGTTKDNIGLFSPSGDSFAFHLLAGEACVGYIAVPKPFVDEETTQIGDKMEWKMKTVTGGSQQSMIGHQESAPPLMRVFVGPKK